jgi:hypothetical protein
MRNHIGDEQLAASKKMREQLKHRKREQEIRERNKREAVNTRRNIIIGELVSQYFPEVLNLQPKRTADANKAEFEDFEKILSAIAADNNYIMRLIKK